MAATRRLVFAAIITLAACSSGDDSSDVSSDAGAATTSTSTPAPTTASTEPGQATSTTAAAAPAPRTATTRAPSTRTNAPAPTTTTTAKSSPPPPPPTTASTAPPAGPTAAITIQNFTFSPAVLNIATGTTVTATNRDSAPHSWTADNGSWDSGTLDQNEQFSRKFSAPGTFPYHCAIHPSMKATVNVS